MTKLDLDEEIIKFIKSSGDEELCMDVLKFVKKECNEKNINVVDYRWKSLVSHISGMIKRSIHNEKIDIDESLFSEISEESFQISKNIVNKIGNLEQGESYLLSVHFETAKQNL